MNKSNFDYVAEIDPRRSGSKNLLTVSKIRIIKISIRRNKDNSARLNENND